jgi:hypothetical protein
MRVVMLDYPFGTFNENGRRYQVRLECRIEPAQLRATGRTIDHGPIPADAVEIAITGTVWRANRDGTRDRRYVDCVSAGQVIDDLRRVPGERAARIATLWDRWHLNGMRPNCAHMPDQTYTPGRVCYAVPNCHPYREAPLVGPQPVPNRVATRGRTCADCDGPAGDPAHGYHSGASWLFEPVPPEIIDELRRTFGLREERP